MKMTTKYLRDLDAWIAENVFGWAWYSAMGQAFLFPPNRFDDLNGFSVHWERGLHSKGWTKQEPDKKESKKCLSPTSIFGDDNILEIPHYTTDPAASDALDDKILEKLATNNEFYTVKHYLGGEITMRAVFKGKNIITSYPAKEICRALFAKKLFTK